MFPKLIEIGDFFLPTYGLLVALGFLAGLWVAGHLAQRNKLDPKAVTDLGIYLALAGLVGAKLMMIAYDLPFYLSHPGDLFSIATLQAGGVFHGGLIAALLVAIWFVKKKNLPFLTIGDIFAPGVALGHGIGRLGCFAAGCCWGAKCDQPWAVTFTNPDAHQMVGVPLGIPLHPSQIYEALAEAAIFGILWVRSGQKHAKGEILALYLMLYPFARFVVEFVRHHEQSLTLGLSLAQWVTLGLIAIGMGVFLRVRRTAIL